ncbi:MAG: BlaI/MecI/CopY family transcriptional regulator [Pseudomonadota bacterium]
MARKRKTELTEAEHRIMAVLWRTGEATVRQITDLLDAEHGLAYTTVLTTIGIMADKGFVAFRKEGRAHVYTPLVSREGAQRKALGSLLVSLFEGSPQQLAQRLVQDEQLSLDDIEALRVELLNRAKSQQETDK